MHEKPPHPRGDAAHARIDEERFRYHIVFAERLIADPDALLECARSNLARWLRSHRASRP